MMLAWADQEEQERDRFPRREDNNQKRNGDPRSDKSQRNFDKKRKPEDTVATMERGKKARREINRTISKNYSKDLALCALKESTRSSNALTFASLSNNVNWMKTKRRKINKTMKMATKMEPWDSSNSPTGST